MSDVHCAARLFVVSQTPFQGQVGIDRLAVLADRLRPERIAAVHHAPDPGMAAPAGRLAALLGVMAVTTDGLQESGTETMVDNAAAALQGIADSYRGEAVVVVANGALIELVLPRLATNVPGEPAAQRPVGRGDIVELAADADGWQLVP
ncbi:MAG: histidine phosphatase family protein [Actinomycetota bacterium]|nr:histidine phosphatase family protein [Actinomycetota bacterium]